MDGRKCAGGRAWRLADLFAGMGGMRLGFEQAFGQEIRTVLACEIDARARRTYLANFPGTPMHGDITLLEDAGVPAFDICLAGFPCQPFSRAGRRLGLADGRGRLFLEAARVCAAGRPKVVLCENVESLLRHDGGRTFAAVRRAFENIGFEVFHKVLDSRDFGVPQTRRRLWVAAFAKGLLDGPFGFPEGAGPRRTLADAREAEPVAAGFYLSRRYLDSLAARTARNRARGNNFGCRIRRWDEPAGTLARGGMGRERNLVIDPRTDARALDPTRNGASVRRLTPREWARCQGFPDSYILYPSPTTACEQLGDSVPVPVVRAIAAEIKKILDSKRSES